MKLSIILLLLLIPLVTVNFNFSVTALQKNPVAKVATEMLTSTNEEVIDNTQISLQTATANLNIEHTSNTSINAEVPKDLPSNIPEFQVEKKAKYLMSFEVEMLNNTGKQIMLLRVILIDAETKNVSKVENFIAYMTDEHDVVVENMNLEYHVDCGCSSCNSVTENFSVRNITVEEAYFIMTTWYNVTVLDVRTDEEYAEGHIPGAILIPHDDILAKHDELPIDKNAPIIVYCGSGTRSIFVANLLVDMGYTRVYNMYQGFNTWLADKYPFFKGNESGNIEPSERVIESKGLCEQHGLISCETNADCPYDWMCMTVCESYDWGNYACYLILGTCFAYLALCFALADWQYCIEFMACMSSYYYDCCLRWMKCCFEVV